MGLISSSQSIDMVDNPQEKTNMFRKDSNHLRRKWDLQGDLLDHGEAGRSATLDGSCIRGLRRLCIDMAYAMIRSDS
jgi:hypothetical protein